MPSWRRPHRRVPRPVPGKHARYYLTRDEGAQKPLMVAVLRGDREMTRLLLARGASVRPTRRLTKYPLGMAADRRATSR